MTKLSVENSPVAVGDYEYTKKYAKQMLKNTIFIGRYHEKRLAEYLNSYRDVISIDTNEGQFIENLLAVKKKITETYLKKTWIGITETESSGGTPNYSLWVELTENVFGEFWFKVKTVEFLDNEVRLKLENVRPVKQESPCRSTLDISDIKNLIPTIKGLPLLLLERFICFCKENLTYDNTKHTVIFIFLLASTLVVGIVNGIKYFLEYLLKLLREVSGLIKVLTPIILNFFNLIQRLVFGLYHMIILLFQGKPKPQPVYNLIYNPEFRDPRERYNQYFALPPHNWNQGTGARIRSINY